MLKYVRLGEYGTTERGQTFSLYVAGETFDIFSFEHKRQATTEIWQTEIVNFKTAWPTWWNW